MHSVANDFIKGLKRFKAINMFVMRDLKHRYQRTKLGPFWISLSMAILVITLAFVLGRVFNTDINKHLPFLAAGLIFWSFLSNSVSEACIAFANNEEYIKSINLPYSFYIYRIAWSNIIIFLHNMIVYICMAIYFDLIFSINLFYLISGFLIFLLNCLWVMMLFSLICVRYRDISNVVQNLLQIAFYFTPIIWMPSAIVGQDSYFITLNPLFHLLEVVRQPLLGQVPGMISFTISMGCLLIGWVIVFLAYMRYRNSIAYWV